MVVQGELGAHGAGRVLTGWSVSVSREHKRPMVAFVVVAVACAVLVVNAARGSAVDLLRGPLPVVAATKVWHLVPGVEHPERPAAPAPQPIAAPVARPGAPTTPTTPAGEARPERASEASPAAHRSKPDRTRERAARGTRDGAEDRKRERGRDSTHATKRDHRPEGRSTTPSRGAKADHGRHQRADDRSTGWARSRSEKAHRGRDGQKGHERSAGSRGHDRAEAARQGDRGRDHGRQHGDAGRGHGARHGHGARGR